MVDFMKPRFMCFPFKTPGSTFSPESNSFWVLGHLAINFGISLSPFVWANMGVTGRQAPFPADPVHAVVRWSIIVSI